MGALIQPPVAYLGAHACGFNFLKVCHSAALATFIALSMSTARLCQPLPSPIKITTVLTSCAKVYRQSKRVQPK